MDELFRIASAYEKAELTMLVLQDRRNDKFYNLFTIIELVPVEQIPSEKIGTIELPFERINIDADYTLFIGRAFELTPKEAVEVYSNSQTGYEFKFGSGSQFIDLFPDVSLVTEPPDDYPLIIHSGSKSDLDMVLPHRNTGFRMWTKLDKGKSWLQSFSLKQLKKIFQKAGEFTSRYLNFDISTAQEHLGNIYLCGCNPLLRKYNLSLLDSNKRLLVEMNERAGKSIVGAILLLEEKRGTQIGFSIKVIIESIFQIIDLPYFPDELITTIYDIDGRLLEKHYGVWVNIAANLRFGGTELHLTIEKDDKTELIKIPKYGKGQEVKVGAYDHSNAQYFKQAAQNRRFLELEQSKEFIFFPGNNGDKEKAEIHIREIVSNASTRCMFLDPYFGAVDMVYAMVVQNIGFPVQIISSANFLRGKINKNPDSITHAEKLLQVIEDYKRLFPNQEIECRVLIGNNRSPLHDRYIIVDNKVYLLGSSFNEFGSRATTLSKVPTPDRMITQAEKWWGDDSKTYTLSEFITLLNTTTDV